MEIIMKSMMEYKGYHATIEFDADDRIFVGEVFGLADSLNFHGSTVDELELMFHQSIDNYLKLCEEFGREPEKAFSGSFNVRISPELHKKISLLAADHHETLNHYLKTMIQDTVERETRREKVYFVSSVLTGQFHLPIPNTREAEIFNGFENTETKTERKYTVCTA